MKNICGYTKQDLQYIRNFIKEINDEIVVRISPAGSFECFLTTFKLRLGKKKAPIEQDILWQEWYEQQDFYMGEVNKRMISLLHEVGHFETFDVNEWLFRNEQQDILINKYLNGEMTLKEINFAYWDLVNEYKATKWAVEYYMKNKNKCDALAKILNFK
jgi:hypothetical protein